MTYRRWWGPLAAALATTPALAGCDDGNDSPPPPGQSDAGATGGATTGGGAGNASAGSGGASAGSGGASAGSGGASAGAGGASAGMGGAPTRLDVLERLESVEGLQVSEIPADEAGQRWFVLGLRQPVDHADPSAGQFQQRMVLLHRDEKAPLEFVLSGYGYQSSHPGDTEITERLLGGNVLFVEHRFFGTSKPDLGAEPPWQYLTIRQAAADHHDIVESLKPIYAGRWVSEGVSKGGMTALYHHRFYPNDLDAVVAYVAPNSLGTDDQRYPAFLASVGDAACREKIVGVQRAALARRGEVMPPLEARLAEGGYVFSRLGDFEIAFEHAVQEYRFAFWQYGRPADCDAMPDPAGEAIALVDTLEGVARGFSDLYLDFYAPYYYQAATELGQYGPLEDGIADLLAFPGTYRVTNYPPLGVPKAFDADATPDVAAWLSSEAEHVILTYGEFDPWTAGSFDPGASTAVRRFTVAGGNHGSFLDDLSEQDRDAAYGLLSTWLGVPAKPPTAPVRRRAASAASWQQRWRDGGRL
jgi:hypothetical protein